MLYIPAEALSIADRFFFVLEEMKRRKEIRGLQTFTKRHGLNYGNMNTLKNHRDKHALRTEHLAYLVQDFNISCEWLLLGRGNMFKPETSKTEESPCPQTSGRASFVRP